MPTFLIADDSPEKMNFLRHILGIADWQGEVLTAGTSEEAIAYVDASTEIAAAFVDFYIPRLNGPAIIHRIKTKFPDARVALVSSADSAKNAAEAKDAGAETVICTSYPLDAVERKILETLYAWMGKEH